MMRLLYTSFFFFFIFNLVGQEISLKNAVVIDQFNERSGNRALVLNEIENILTKKQLKLYDWNQSSHTLQAVGATIGSEEPVRNVSLATIVVSENPKTFPLHIITDTTGKTTQVYYFSNPSIDFKSKTVEVLTNRIFTLNEKLYSPSRNGNTNTDGRVFVQDFTKEFGMDPAQLKRTDYKAYEKKEKELYTKYLPIIIKYTNRNLSNFASTIAYSILNAGSTGNTDYYTVQKNEDLKDEKKIKYVTIDKKEGDEITTNDVFDMYQVFSWGNISSTKPIQRFNVEEIAPTFARLSLAAFGSKKKVAEVMKEDAPVLVFKSEFAVDNYNKKQNNVKESFYSAVKKDCLFCNIDFEMSILKVPSIYLIERNAPETKYFQELLKREEFIDYADSDKLNSQLGVKYLFYLEDGVVMATDIETGRVISNNSNKDKLLTIRETNATRVKMIVSDVTKKEIKLLEVTDQSKSKIKEIMLYSELGFLLGERLKFYVIEKEKVAGKEVNRKKYIGIIKIIKPVSNLVFIGDVSVGDKELFKFMESKTDVFFEYTTDKNL